MTDPQTSRNLPSGLPPLEPEAREHQAAVARYLAEQIRQAPGGFLPFDQWMHHTLYAPSLGYYAAGSTKFGDATLGGDFTTAPELTPLFGRTLAAQVAQVLHASGSDSVLEFGAGSGALAASLIPALRDLGIEPKYRIMEVSADLKERQFDRLAPLQADVRWLDALPDGFEGCVIANEVMDAMPVHLFRWQEDGALHELGIVCEDDAFAMAQREAPPQLARALEQRMPAYPGYRSEINLQAEAWIRGMGDWLRRGAALLIDYGFPRHEYYHPQRAEGTLMCHFRHHAHSDPLAYPGLQDITAHVDFTAMADTALEAGLDVMGYTSQARFLLNCGLMAHLPLNGAADGMEQAMALAAVQKLLSEAEMGELFKVLAIARGIEAPLLGFQQGDRRHRL